MAEPQVKDAAVNFDIDLERQADGNHDVPKDGRNQYVNRGNRLLGKFSRSRSNRRSFNLKRLPAGLVNRSETPLSTSLRIQAIQVLFALPAQDALKWPGIFVFCQHLGDDFQELLEDRYEVIWRIIQRERPLSSVKCWYWCFAVIATLQALQDGDASIEKVYLLLAEKSKNESLVIKPHERIHVLKAIFAVVCWTSAMVKPILDDGSTNVNNPIQTQLSLTAEIFSQRHSSKDLRRPMSKMFNSFRSQAEDCQQSECLDAQTASAGEDVSPDVLYESSLNYFSLSTIGHVKLKWVDTLTAHLMFDRSTRTLSIFRFPSFCVANALRENDIEVLKNVTNKLLPSNSYTGSFEEHSSVHREVLLSYRLLFGQSSRARKLMAQLLNSSPDTAAGASATIHNHHNIFSYRQSVRSSNNTIEDDGIDPFLPIICGSPLSSRWQHHGFRRRDTSSLVLPSKIFPSSALDLKGYLQESNTYSMRDDFPVFGSRLSKLQNYNMRQRPSKVKDLWRDWRNPLQWYTFWAVFWIGGVTVVLSLLQLLVGTLQLYYAIQPLSNSEDVTTLRMGVGVESTVQ